MTEAVTDREWEEHRATAREQLPAVVEPDGVLLAYQQELLRAMAENEVVIVEKSRRIGDLGHRL
jgi:hypothetical protein